MRSQLTADRWQKAKAIVADAVELSSRTQRAAFVTEQCGDDESLRQEVEALLDTPTGGFDDLAEAVSTPYGQLQAGRRIGEYEVIRELGRGGMGAVYLAHRADGEFDRQVAVKLLKRGIDTDEILARFKAERRILARLDHPNIARLLDAGTTDDGLPYFVMEYVADGEPLTVFARTHDLSVSARLELFRKVSAAVQFAHQNLVVHRDLKPDNILVTAAGEPKLLDFGIAKLLASDEDAWAMTIPGEERLTPAYASPEQVRGESITTMSDVYSLGALLYKLLTDKSAHNFSAARPSATALQRVICQTEPQRPSLAVEEPERARALRGDLDNIVLRALAKAPERRYASAGHLGDDLRRYLEGRPVRARKDTLGYRASKFVARNKVGVAVAALALLTLLSAFVATMTQRNRAERQSLRAETSEYNSRRLLYAAQMNLAYQAWESANVGRALDLLEAERPKAGQEDLRGFEWRLLWRLAHERGRTLPGPTSLATRVRFSRDAGKVVAATLDGKAFVWDAATGQLLKSFETGGTYVALTTDGQSIVTGSADGSTKQWDIASGGLKRSFGGHTAAVVCIASSPDGETLATASFDGTAKIWSVATGQLLVTLKGHGDALNSVAFSPDGQLLATGSHDHTAKLWEAASGKEIATLAGHSWWVSDAEFAPDGKTLATSGSDGEIKLWDVANHLEIGTIHGDGATIGELRFSPDARWLAAAAADSTVRLYETSSRKLFDTLRGQLGEVISVAFSPDGKTLASSGASGVRLWDLTRPAGVVSLNAHSDWVWAIAFSPDGRTLASASKDATVKLWDVAAGREVMTLRHPQWVNGVAFSPDGAHLATADDDMLVRLWNPLTGENIATLNGHHAIVECVAFTPDGKVLASGSKTGEIKLWETATGREIGTFHSPNPDLIWSLAFSPDGKHLAVAEGSALSFPRPHAVTVWDVRSERIVATLQGHTNDVAAVAFAPDGSGLASASWDGTIKLWDLKTQHEIVTLKGQRAVNSLYFSAKGNRLVSAGSDKTVKIWDMSARQELCTVTLPSEVTSAAFSPNDGTLAAGSKDGLVRLWFAASDEESSGPK